jgi:translation initiation factor 1A
MGKNKSRGGKKHKRGKANRNTNNGDLELKDDLQEYGLVIKLLGNCRCEIKCSDGVTRLGHIRGKMKKRVWVNTGDIILASLRDYQDGKCDIIVKYNPSEINKLKSYGEIPQLFDRNDNNDTLENSEVEEVFDFDDI